MIETEGVGHRLEVIERRKAGPSEVEVHGRLALADAIGELRDAQPSRVQEPLQVACEAAVEHGGILFHTSDFSSHARCPRRSRRLSLERADNAVAALKTTSLRTFRCATKTTVRPSWGKGRAGTGTTGMHPTTAGAARERKGCPKRQGVNECPARLRAPGGSNLGNGGRTPKGESRRRHRSRRRAMKLPPASRPVFGLAGIGWPGFGARPTGLTVGPILYTIS